MSTLYFEVEADYDKVIRLRQEIDRLKAEMESFSSSTPDAQIRATEKRLGEATAEFRRLTDAAAVAGTEMEQSLRSRLKAATQTMNSLTERIIEQKAVVRDTAADVKRLGEAYKAAAKNGRMGSGANAALAEYKAAKMALDEDKAALFDFTQQQAEARLSMQRLNAQYRDFKQAGREAADTAKGVGDEVNKLGENAQTQASGINSALAGMKGTIAAVFGAQQISSFVNKMIAVRGQFQAADVAIQTLLGSKAKADQLMEQVRDYAKISPLEFSDVTAATQMMLGFNIEAEKVPGFLRAIGDVSMGDSQRFNSLTLAFSQMSAAGKLMGQDLLNIAA